jgi:hypothetical protein
VFALVSAATVGAVLASRRPRHPVGWLLLALAVFLGADGVVSGYLPYGLVVRPGALPAPSSMVLSYPAFAVAALACIGFVLLLTPTGSLPSHRWRWWAWLAAAVPVACLLVAVLAPGPSASRIQVADSPFNLRAFDGVVLAAIQVAVAVTLLAVAVAAGSLVVRFRRARGVERQQLRWVMLAAALVALGAVAGLAASAMGATALIGSGGTQVFVALVPVAIGAAILRYRLYDLDRIISRALAYGLLTVLLGGGYAGWSLGSANSPANAPAWRWPGRPWRWQGCSSRSAAASSGWWTGGSTAAATTPPRRSRHSAPGCASRSTWTR